MQVLPPWILYRTCLGERVSVMWIPKVQINQIWALVNPKWSRAYKLRRYQLYEKAVFAELASMRARCMIAGELYENTYGKLCEHWIRVRCMSTCEVYEHVWGVWARVRCYEHVGGVRARASCMSVCEVYDQMYCPGLIWGGGSKLCCLELRGAHGEVGQLLAAPLLLLQELLPPRLVLYNAPLHLRRHPR